MNTFAKALSVVAAMISFTSFAEDITTDVKAKLDKKFSLVEKLAASPAIQKAVAARNKKTPEEFVGMTQDKWKAATLLDKNVRSLTKDETAEALKTFQKNDGAVSEAFVSCADGTKVGFISKPTNWSHKGKPKHDDPMAGKRWTGPVEVDSSSGLKQIQISVPVMIEGKPAGSIVVGYQLLKI